MSYRGRSHRLEVVSIESTYTNLLGGERIEKVVIDLSELFTGTVDRLHVSFAAVLQSHKDLFTKELDKCWKIRFTSRQKVTQRPNI